MPASLPLGCHVVTLGLVLVLWLETSASPCVTTFQANGLSFQPHIVLHCGDQFFVAVVTAGKELSDGPQRPGEVAGCFT